ncbi:MAG TPA: hypothetical protein VL549_05855 [Gemmatimonadales bacterium]|nr:hypothetical protein [Gemmatimonadales bacterium]
MRFAVLSILLVACATSRIPAHLRGYDIVVEPKDEQSKALAGAMREYGFRVREHVRGGSRPTAVLIHFAFREPRGDPGQPVWLYLRLADTRSGVIVATASIPLDSVGSSPRARAEAAVRALAPAP